MKTNILLFSLGLCMVFFLTGCGADKEIPQETTEAAETTESTKEASVTDTVDETELYGKFLNDEIDATIHSEYFGENENFAIDSADIEFIKNYGDVGYENSREIGDILAFSDLKQYVQDEYGEDDWVDYSCISYAYITCGGNSHESLIIQFAGNDETADGNLFFVINEENGTLYLTYSLASWARSHVELTSNGLLSGTGSSSAGNVHIWTSVLDENAVRQAVVDADTYGGTWIMDLDDICDVYQEIFGDESAPISITKYKIGDNTCYTYEIEDGSSSESDKIDYFISSSNLTWYTEEEINSLIEQRKEALQISPFVFDDRTDISWLPLEMGTPGNVVENNTLEQTSENISSDVLEQVIDINQAWTGYISSSDGSDFYLTFLFDSDETFFCAYYVAESGYVYRGKGTYDFTGQKMTVSYIWDFDETETPSVTEYGFEKSEDGFVLTQISGIGLGSEENGDMFYFRKDADTSASEWEDFIISGWGYEPQ